MSTYSPLPHLFDDNTNQHVVNVHRNIKHMFQPVPISNYYNITIPQIDSGMNNISDLIRHNNFTLNVLVYILLQSVVLGQRFIDFSLIRRIISSPSKEVTIALIPKEETTDKHPISLMNDIEAFLTIYTSQHLFTGFKHATSLIHYINGYCKKNPLTISHLPTFSFSKTSSTLPTTYWSSSMTTRNYSSTTPRWNSSTLSVISFDVPLPAMQNGLPNHPPSQNLM